jgi:hypothetical protein
LRLIASATARLVEVVDEVEREGHWEGHRSPEAWTALKCGTTPAHARQLVATARGLRDLPRVRAAFEAGSITGDHVSVMVNRGLTSEHEAQALRLAEVASVSQLRTALSFLPQPEREDSPRPEPSVRFGQRAEGMWRAVIELFPEDGELFAKALEAGRDEVFCDSHPDLDGDPDPRGAQGNNLGRRGRARSTRGADRSAPNHPTHRVNHPTSPPGSTESRPPTTRHAAANTPTGPGSAGSNA